MVCLIIRSTVFEGGSNGRPLEIRNQLLLGGGKEYFRSGAVQNNIGKSAFLKGIST